MVVGVQDVLIPVLLVPVETVVVVMGGSPGPEPLERPILVAVAVAELLRKRGATAAQASQSLLTSDHSAERVGLSHRQVATQFTRSHLRVRSTRKEAKKMGNFAKVANRAVIDVIAAEPSFFIPRDQGGDGFVDTSPGTWLQVSYNTRGGVHYDPVTGSPSADQSKALRGNYPGIGWLHDSEHDKFYPQQSFASWALNKTTWLWDAPIPMPKDGKPYRWDEPTLTWVEVVAPTPTA